MRNTIVVTGGSRGIGKAILEKFAQNDFDLITCSRKEEDLVALKKELKGKFPLVNVETLKSDLSQEKDREEFVRFVNGLTDKVDVLVNNTGVFMPGQIHKEEPGILEKTIETNLYSAYHITRGLLDSMMRRKKGHIFNICSTASIMPYVNGGSYCISKYAMYGMTKVLREEMKPLNIKVTAVLPGATLTSSWEGVDLPAERFIKPEDVAKAVFDIFNLSETTDVEEILIRPQLGDI
ncbi:MAG TPA: SDR family oxidoreductase [Cytophagaceae bacterium]